MKSITFIVVLLVALVGGLLWYEEQTPAASNVSTYKSDTYGISFDYPNTYALQERDLGNAERYHYAAVLIDKKMLANVPQNGEGPTTINVDVFQNELDKLSVEEWIRGSNNSNFKLSPNGVLTSKTVAGVPAFSYVVDGLYRSGVVVFAHKGNIVMLTVSYFSPDDQIRADFAQILSELNLF